MQQDTYCHRSSSYYYYYYLPPLPLSFLSVTEAVISKNKPKRHPHGCWKMTNHKKAWSGLGLRPPNVKSLCFAQAGLDPERAQRRESKSRREPAHTKQLHSVIVRVAVVFLLARTCLCFALLLNMCAKNKVVRAAVEICVRDTEWFTRERDLRACRCVFDFWHKYNAIWG